MTGYQIQRHRILLCVLALFCLGMALMGCKKASLDDWYATQADQFQELDFFIIMKQEIREESVHGIQGIQ